MATKKEERPPLGVVKKNIEKDSGILVEGNVRFLKEIQFNIETMCCSFNNSGKLLAVGLANGTIKIYSLDSKSVVYILQCPDNKLPVTCIKWKPDKIEQLYGHVLSATYASGQICRWHVTTGKCLQSYTEVVQLLACAYNVSGTNCIAGGSDGKIYVYDEVTNKRTMVMEPSTSVDIMDGHVWRIFSVQYHPTDDHVFVSGGWDDTIQWWDTRVSSSYSIKKIVGPHICGEGAIDIEPITFNMVTASWQKHHNLKVYDFGTGKLIKEIPSDFTKSMLYCAQWKNRKSMLVGGSHSNMMRYIDFDSEQTIGRVINLPGAVYSIDSNKLGIHPTVAFCSNTSVVLVEDTIG